MTPAIITIAGAAFFLVAIFLLLSEKNRLDTRIIDLKDDLDEKSFELFERRQESSSIPYGSVQIVDNLYFHCIEVYVKIDKRDYVLRRYELVEKSKLQELEIARRARNNGAVWLKRSDVDYLFPDLGKEVEE